MHCHRGPTALHTSQHSSSSSSRRCTILACNLHMQAPASLLDPAVCRRCAAATDAVMCGCCLRCAPSPAPHTTHTHAPPSPQAALAKGSATQQELQQLIFDISTASRNLVKNQTTWFRDDQMFK